MLNDVSKQLIQELTTEEVKTTLRYPLAYKEEYRRLLETEASFWK